MENDQRTSRRNFIKLAATGIATTSISSRVFALERTYEFGGRPFSQNDKIRVALIGTGGRGMDITMNAIRVPGVELMACADVYQGRLTRAKEIWGQEFKGLFTTRDYREILSRSDVDAVIIATPDHWHSKIAVDAMNAGKDVYLEKPMVQKVDEGHAVIEAAKKNNRILQVGSQRVSSIIYQKAKELLAAGAIGELNMIEAWWDRNSALGAWQYSIPPDASPQTVDWDRFIGSAPKRPFEPIRLFRWRNYQDYGTGVAGDLFVHLFSGMHFVVNAKGPTRVMTTGGLRYWKDGRDVPDIMLGLYDYPVTPQHPAFNLFLKVNFADGGGDSSEFKFIGNNGLMSIGNSGVTVTKKVPEKEPGFSVETFPEALQRQYLDDYRKQYPSRKGVDRMRSDEVENYTVGRNYNDVYDHFVNFFAAVRSRQPVIEDATFGFRAAGPALLSNLAYFNNRIYQWDPETMKINGEAKS
ncbi:MAG TPA: Gfo/Idh/MocA family oxidoreductase [Blastocatellia bacterium]|nr:Gfo/Idh/MocA family oxidoreductase [Blastocatellia bacterium]